MLFRSGGRYVAETLMPLVLELDRAYTAAKNDPAFQERVSLYRSHCTRVHGNSTKYCKLDEERFPIGKKFWWQDFDDCGYNFRMTDIQAAISVANTITPACPFSLPTRIRTLAKASQREPARAY